MLIDPNQLYYKLEDQLLACIFNPVKLDSLMRGPILPKHSTRQTTGAGMYK